MNSTMEPSVMEPDELASYTDDPSLLKNLSSICMFGTGVQSNGVFYGDNPLHYSAPLLFLQLSLITAVTIVTVFLLKPLGQPVMVSQILGGIILGPSVLGRIGGFSSAVFPFPSLVVLDTVSLFGLMFYLFLIGVQMDPWIIKKTGKKAIAIGISTVLVPMVISVSCASILSRFSSIDHSITSSLPLVGIAESVLAFPIIARYLTELKILNSEFGRVALSSSMVSGIFSFCLMSITVLMQKDLGKVFAMLTTLSTAAAVAMAIVFILRPAFLWMIQQNPKEEPLKEDCICAVLVGVLVTGLVSQVTGLNILFGPIILGMSLPAGPPLGSALVEKLDIIIVWIILPIYFVKNGLATNVFAIQLPHLVVVESIILICCTGKFIGALLPCLYCKMPLRDAVSLALVMNVQGVLELGLFKMLKRIKLVDDEAFVIMCTSMLMVTAAITPLIKHLYNPSRRYLVYKRRTILHSRPNTELRILVCIHDQDNVATMMNILEASNPTKANPIGVYVVHLMELVGRSTPLLITHQLSKTSSSNATPEERIINAFKYYEQSNVQGAVSVHPFTAISPYVSMHDDVCTLALDRRTSIIIVPFHKQYSSSISGFKIMNKNVLQNAPCSVAILVDRGPSVPSRSLLACWRSYPIAVFFLGGPDDREALALGARMAGNPRVYLTVVRLLENGNINARESKLDNEVMSEFRFSMKGNDQVMYVEEVVMDGSGTVSVIRSMENRFQLIMAGRRHDKRSPLMLGLADWNESTELGAIGDMFASPDFSGDTSILVVQQHAINIHVAAAAGLNENSEHQPAHLTELNLKVAHDVIEDDEFIRLQMRSLY
ncbi:hypothetical protein HHK36_015881 [Tetracentron sinense]|uniref:Cation/H+ exchanger domain-containing protein n=1 Tax=Tetracentron sinense TaxID=13715 RepID=A0A835DD84_TETSI|nr:hypothetical protein HHK36_015881 [Tetracentron sinense]